MRSQLIVRRYAQGIIGAIKDNAEYELITGKLSGFAEFISGQEKLKDFLYRLFFPKNKRIQVVKDLLEEGGVKGKSARLITLLVERDRLFLLPEVLELLPVLWNEKRGIATYEVSSAVALSEDQRERLEAKLASLEKGPVFLNYRVDPELLGGISLRKGNIIYDSSLQGHLARLREKIIEG